MVLAVRDVAAASQGHLLVSGAVVDAVSSGTKRFTHTPRVILPHLSARRNVASPYNVGTSEVTPSYHPHGM